MNYKYVLMRVAEKNKSREILVNPSFQETRQLVALKTLRTFISVKIYDQPEIPVRIRSRLLTEPGL